MPILTLLKRVSDKYVHPPHPFISQRPALKVCYLTGLAMQAHADGHLDENERLHFLEMASVFDVEETEALDILERAKSPDEAVVEGLRANLLHSKYKYYFILDLQIMAHQDNHIHEVERKVLDRFAELLNVDREDADFLVELANAVVSESPRAKAEWVANFFRRMKVQQAGPDDFAHYIRDSGETGPA